MPCRDAPDSLVCYENKCTYMKLLGWLNAGSPVEWCAEGGMIGAELTVLGLTAP